MIEFFLAVNALFLGYSVGRLHALHEHFKSEGCLGKTNQNENA